MLKTYNSKVLNKNHPANKQHILTLISPSNRFRLERLSEFPMPEHFRNQFADFAKRSATQCNETNNEKRIIDRSYIKTVPSDPALSNIDIQNLNENNKVILNNLTKEFSENHFTKQWSPAILLSKIAFIEHCNRAKNRQLPNKELV